MRATQKILRFSYSLYSPQQEITAKLTSTMGFQHNSGDHNSSSAREQNWMENVFHELTKVGFRRWVITNFSELKEHFPTQCKDTKNLEKRLDEMITRITSIEKNINDLMELKNTA
ncbi:LINE-1 retrotransposable element ORF1 protein [Plecturocebus cupreus]